MKRLLVVEVTLTPTALPSTLALLSWRPQVMQNNNGAAHMAVLRDNVRCNETLCSRSLCCVEWYSTIEGRCHVRQVERLF